jgi:hypothetical protein
LKEIVRGAHKVSMLATITTLITGLETIWANRQAKKSASLFMMRAELECAVLSLLGEGPEIGR